MRVYTMYEILTLGTDLETIQNYMLSNNDIMGMNRALEDYNNKYALKTYDEDELYKMESGLRSLIETYLSKSKNNKFSVAIDNITIYKVKNSLVYQLNNQDNIYNNQEVLKQAFHRTFADYVKDGLVSKEEYKQGLTEDFLAITFVLIEKGRPIGIIEPGELSGHNRRLVKNKWNYIARIQHPELNMYDEDDDTGLYYDDDDEDDDW